MNKKQLAAQLAGEASRRALKDMKDAYITFELNPSALVMLSLSQKMKAFKQARDTEHAIAEWED